MKRDLETVRLPGGWICSKKLFVRGKCSRRCFPEHLPWQCDPQIVSGEVLWKDGTVKWLSRLLLLPVFLFLGGCASVSSTSVFYQQTTANSYPPKPGNAVIPILAAAPSRPYQEIGRFAFQTTLGYSFAVKSALYNAHQAGADAVILKSCQSWSVPYSYVVPPSYGWVPVGVGGGCGYWGGAVVPVVYPGYSGVSYQNFTGIDARMIIYR
jgi:hypothetical protein